MPKPVSCQGCPLAELGTGFAPPIGPKAAKLLFVGEALGEVEAKQSKPFVGPAGQWLNRLFRQIGIDREEVRITNVVSCKPPNDWLVGAPWEKAAIAHCSRHLQLVLEEDHKVVVALGATAGKVLTQDHRYSGLLWHGCAVPILQKVVVPTFHPAYIIRGNHNLTGVVAHDIQKAKEVSEEGYHPDPISLQIDPEVGWFNDWIDTYIESREASWLAVDIETAGKIGKDEDELGEDQTPITRINFSYNPDEGVTVPWEEAYMPGIKRLLSHNGVKIFWYLHYDGPKLTAQGAPPNGTVLDAMDMWHVLQSDLPKKLGFVAPFYSKQMHPWKHLFESEPGKYAALDAVHTLRIAHGVCKQLTDQNRWDAYWRHCYQLDTTVLRPAEKEGLLVDKVELERFGAELKAQKDISYTKTQSLIPDDIKPLYPRAGWKKPPGDRKADMLEFDRTAVVQVCTSCNQAEVAKTHRCKDKKLQPKIELLERVVKRYYVREEFNPGSSKQVLDYIRYKKLKPGKNKKTKAASADEKALNRLAKTKDPLFKEVLAYRKVQKVEGTYVNGARKRIADDGRLHCTFTHNPSTPRLACEDPNLQNVVSDKEGSEALAAGFRHCLVAMPGCALVEADYSGIEAVETGWFAGDPAYIRLARLGVHAYLTSHLVGNPADLDWEDEKLAAHLAWVKKHHKLEYRKVKGVVHGANYGRTAFGMHAGEPELFENVEAAQRIEDLYYSLCPKLPKWQEDIRRRAHKQHYLGGDDHPFKYKHWFWSVYVFNNKTKKYTLGDDGKRCIAFYPQSTAAGVLYEACLRLMRPGGDNYIGDLYNGRTPIRALIHDSILAEVPKNKLDEYMTKVHAEMTRPIQQQPCPPEWNMGTHLQIGVEIKVGTTWGSMEEVV